MKRILLLAGAIVLVDTLFAAALTPLLPHYAHRLGLGKAGAGLLAAAYPLGTLVGALPSGVVAARFGVKRTAIAGMSVVALTTALFGVGSTVWELDLARACQGVASAFSWTGALTWLAAAAPRARRGTLIGQAFAFAILGALLGPVLGGIASVAGTGVTFGAVAAASLALAGWAASTPAIRPEVRQPLSALLAALGDRRVQVGSWLVILPGLLFGTLGVLAPLRLAALGVGGVGIGAIWLVAGAFEAGNNVLIGRVTDRRGALVPVRAGLAATAVAACLLPWPDDRFLLAAAIVLAGVSFGAFYTPGMTLLTHAAEERALEYAYAFALVNLVWAPGQTLGSSAGGAVAGASSDAVPYLTLAGLALLTLAALWRWRSRSSS